ncbi:hypothetical protein Bbelb_361890 [Branchiostoma belcheri]|nr:hypothetical protein Bbelb_361890 [Branchiostoma belcheri]
MTPGSGREVSASVRLSDVYAYFDLSTAVGHSEPKEGLLRVMASQNKAGSSTDGNEEAKRQLSKFLAGAAKDIGGKVVDKLGDAIAEGVVENHQDEVVSGLENYLGTQMEKFDDEYKELLEKTGGLAAGLKGPVEEGRYGLPLIYNSLVQSLDQGDLWHLVAAETDEKPVPLGETNLRPKPLTASEDRGRQAMAHQQKKQKQKRKSSVKKVTGSGKARRKSVMGERHVRAGVCLGGCVCDDVIV